MLEKIHKYLKLIFLLPIFFFLIKAINPDSDSFFLAATGRFIFENKLVPTTNPFVIHENFEAIFQQWIPALINYFLLENFGPAGMFVYSCIMFVVTLFIFYKYISLFTTSFKLKTFIMFFTAFITRIVATTRPTSLTLPIFIILLYVLEKYKRTKKNKYLFIIPFLSLLEINIHCALWPILFVFICIYFLPEKLPENFNKKTLLNWLFIENKNNIFKMLIVLISSIAIGILNPNGINGMLYLINSFGSATSGNEIQELTKTPILHIYGLYVIFAIIFTTIYIYKEKNNLDLRLLCISLVTIIFSSMYLRNVYFVILGIMPIIGLLLDKKIIDKPSKYSQKEQIFLIIFYSAIIILMTSYTSAVDYNNKDSYYVPEQAANYLDNVNEDIILFNGFNNGAYLEWRGYKVYIDARPELFQKQINKQEDIYTEYRNLKLGLINYEEFLEKYNFTHLLIADEYAFMNFIENNKEYKAVIEGNGYVLYEQIK